jgi:Zn-dependent protease with chaperone function
MVAELVVALGLSSLISLPHLLPLHRVAPMNGAIAWLLGLALRATVSVGAAFFVLAFVPHTSPFRGLAHWCTHTVVPLVSTHVSFSGHALADVTVVLPALALVASLCWLAFGVTRGALALRQLLRRRARGQGPLGSTILADDEVLIAVTGIGRARILVSDTAFATMDGAELRASLTHELGHLRRRHRPLLLLGSLLASLARLLPGTAAAERELIFNLERDADEYAVHVTRDPLALASAICKAATGRTLTPALSLGGRSGVGLRLEYLIEGGRQRSGTTLERATRLLIAAMTAALLAVTATLPSWAAAAPTPMHKGDVVHPCPH